MIQQVWYGFVAPGIKGVYQDYKIIEQLALIFPYPSFGKCRTEEEAWEFVNRKHYSRKPVNIVRYGNTFKDHFVTVDYIIKDDCIYYNVLTKNLGYIQVSNDDPNISIENRAEIIKIKISNIFLNDDSIVSHAIAIFHILNILGGYVDVELIIPDHSIFYMLNSYTGDKPAITKVLKFIKNRKGEISLTMKNWSEREYIE